MRTELFKVTGIETTEELFAQMNKIARAAAISAGERDEETIKEIICESIVKFLERIGKMDVEKGKAMNYLYTTALHETINQYKRKRRNRGNVDAESCRIPIDYGERQAEARNRLEACDKAIMGFQERERDIFYMLKEGYSPQDIAERLLISENATNIAIHKLRKHLRRTIA